MKRLLIQLNVAIVLLLSFSYHCVAADTYTLKYNLEKGKTYKQHSVTEMDATMNAMGQDIKMDMSMDIDINYEVTGKNNGVYDIRMAYQKLKMDMTSPTAYSFDSDAPESSSDNNSIVGALKSFVGVPIDIQLTQQGKVNSVKGVDKLLGKMDSVGNPQFKQMLSQQFSEETIRNMIEQISAYFPDKPVAINDSWDVATEVNTNGVDIDSKMKLTLKQVSDNVATLDCTGTLATPEGGAKFQVQGMDATVKMNGEQAGTILIDMKTGWIVRSDLTQNSTQNIELMGQSMQQKVKTKIILTAD